MSTEETRLEVMEFDLFKQEFELFKVQKVQGLQKLYPGSNNLYSITIKALQNFGFDEIGIEKFLESEGYCLYNVITHFDGLRGWGHMSGPCRVIQFSKNEDVN